MVRIRVFARMTVPTVISGRVFARMENSVVVVVIRWRNVRARRFIVRIVVRSRVFVVTVSVRVVERIRVFARMTVPTAAVVRVFARGCFAIIVATRWMNARARLCIV